MTRVDIFSFNSYRAKNGEADFYVRRHVAKRLEMAFLNRRGKKKVNCWGVKVTGGDSEELRKRLNEDVDWAKYTHNGIGAPGSISNSDVHDAISRFISPIFLAIYKNMQEHYKPYPTFYVRKHYVTTKPIVKAQLDKYDKIKTFIKVVVYSGNIKKIVNSMESIDWSKYKYIKAPHIYEEYWKREGL